MPSPKSPPDYDVAIIGGGSAGYAAAQTATRANLKTAIIDGAQELGGLCILRGCMPTKALLYATEVLHLARRGQTWGLQPHKTQFDFNAVMARKDAVIREFAEFRQQQLTSGPFDLFRASARFLDPLTVQLDSGQQIRAAHFIIATGSIISKPPLPNLALTGYLTSDDALRLKGLPPSLIVLGGGPVAVEFAQFFARLDVRVTMIQRSEHILKSFDTDAAEALESALRREGIELHTNTRLVDASMHGALKQISFDQAGKRFTVEADEILLALGREPNLAGLNLNAAGIRVEQGRIPTDAQARTTAPNIYAAGDCTNPYEFVHLATTQGEIAAHNIAFPHSPRLIDYRLLLSVVFTEPQLASVGLTEKQARALGRNYLTASYPFNDHGKSIIMNSLDGSVKLLADPITGEILGGACTGPIAGDLIHEIVVAMAARLTAHQLAALPHFHPTLAEIWTYPAEELANNIPLLSSSS
jgi:pyruvate/2-oxoglutarate dehydrogenase complex dihydrolipoamide dehydrogenase (E3) component